MAEITQVNYVKEINAFHSYANARLLSAGERLLWFGLMDYINRHEAAGAEWPAGYICISNKQLVSHVPFGENALIDARNKLKQRGLLEFIPGKKNKEAPQYKIHYLTAEKSAGCGQSNRENRGNIRGNIGDNPGGNIGGNIGDNPGGNIGGRPSDIHLNVYVDPDGDPDCDMCTDDDDDGLPLKERRRKELMDAAARAMRESYGREATPVECENLAIVAEVKDFGPDMLRYAISTAALNAARNPVTYVAGIMLNWRRDYVRTKSDAEEAQYEHDAYHSKNGMPVCWEAIDEAREARRKRAMGG